MKQTKFKFLNLKKDDDPTNEIRHINMVNTENDTYNIYKYKTDRKQPYKYIKTDTAPDFRDQYGLEYYVNTIDDKRAYVPVPTQPANTSLPHITSTIQNDMANNPLGVGDSRAYKFTLNKDVAITRQQFINITVRHPKQPIIDTRVVPAVLDPNYIRINSTNANGKPTVFKKINHNNYTNDLNYIVRDDRDRDGEREDSLVDFSN
jgi:hypothetical protein